MDKWADFLISKVLYNQAGDKIEKVIARNDNGDNVGDEIEMSRYTLIQHFANVKTFATITKKPTGKWYILRLQSGFHRNEFLRP
jgi:hypothetical protein